YNFIIDVSSISDFADQDIDTSNMVNEKPIYYIIGQSDLVLGSSFSGFGYLALISCTNITAMNADVGGVLLVNTTISTISNVSSHNSGYGIHLSDSSNNDIINCNSYNNEDGGIYFYIFIIGSIVDIDCITSS
ncbi:unnamed protein product, partial [marine sediment metagenome]